MPSTKRRNDQESPTTDLKKQARNNSSRKKLSDVDNNDDQAAEYETSDSSAAERDHSSTEKQFEEEDEEGEEESGGEEEEIEFEESDGDDDDTEKDHAKLTNAYRPTVDKLAPDEVLDYDPSAYDTFHQFNLGNSCYGMDILRDQLGALRIESPHTLYLAAATQTKEQNRIYLAKCANVRRTWKADEDEMSDDEDADEEDPLLLHSYIRIDHGVNSLKAMPQLSQIVATWNDNATVTIYNIEQHLKVLDDPSKFADNNQKEYYKMSEHREEGFGLAWNSYEIGHLLSGSQDKTVGYLKPHESSWVFSSSYRGHTGSVESISWQNEHIFASGSCDKSIKIWDVRTQSCQLTIENAHRGDVNVVAFRPMEERNHLLSGGDDKLIYLRDIRMPDIKLFAGEYHGDAINNLDWHPTDCAMFAASSYDDSVSIWSLDVEADSNQPSIPGHPQQLLFVHMGQEHISSVLWHPQIQHMILSSAQSGLHIFRPDNLIDDPQIF